jgi:hypothetical protein
MKEKHARSAEESQIPLDQQACQGRGLGELLGRKLGPVGSQMLTGDLQRQPSEPQQFLSSHADSSSPWTPIAVPAILSSQMGFRATFWLPPGRQASPESFPELVSKQYPQKGVSK